jgi:multidrug resistance efflux pump
LPRENHVVFANGVVEGRQRDVPLRFELTGRLASLEVSEGDKVSQGDTLARLDREVWEHEVAKAESAVAYAQAEKERVISGERKETRELAHAQSRAAEARAVVARTHYERAKRLLKKTVITEQEWDDRRADYKSALAQLAAARAHGAEVEAAPREHELRAADAQIALEKTRVEHAQTMLQRTLLQAPADGLVLRVRCEPGEIVGPESAEPLIVMADVSQLHVRAYVEEMDAPVIRKGQRAYAVTDGLPDLQHWGMVISCSPCMVSKTQFSNRADERVDVKVREVVLQLNKSIEENQLIVGLPVDVYIETDELSGDN